MLKDFLFVNLTLALPLTGTILPSGTLSGSLVWAISPAKLGLFVKGKKLLPVMAKVTASRLARLVLSIANLHIFFIR